MERLGARPTLDVNGLSSGFTGEGLKTVIPAKAMAKVSMRLVPNQSPTLVEEELRDYVQARAPSTVTWNVKMLGSASPVLLDRNAPCMRAASSHVFGYEDVERGPRSVRYAPQPKSLEELSTTGDSDAEKALNHLAHINHILRGIGKPTT